MSGAPGILPTPPNYDRLGASTGFDSAVRCFARVATPGHPLGPFLAVTLGLARPASPRPGLVTLPLRSSCSSPQQPSCDPPRLQEEPHIPVDDQIALPAPIRQEEFHKILSLSDVWTTTHGGPAPHRSRSLGASTRICSENDRCENAVLKLLDSKGFPALPGSGPRAAQTHGREMPSRRPRRGTELVFPGRPA